MAQCEISVFMQFLIIPGSDGLRALDVIRSPQTCVQHVLKLSERTRYRAFDCGGLIACGLRIAAHKARFDKTPLIGSAIFVSVCITEMYLNARNMGTETVQPVANFSRHLGG